MFKKSYHAKGNSGKFSFTQFDPSYEIDEFMSSIVDPISDNQVNSMAFGFTLNYKINNETKELSVTKKICNYKLIPELIQRTSLNAEFRVIDTKNPFPGKSGNNDRMIGSNWRHYVDLEVDKNLFRFDLNKNGNIDVAEQKLIFRLLGGNDVPELSGIDYSDLNLSKTSQYAFRASGNLEETEIQKYIKDAPNSYGRKGDGTTVNAKYTITLTPSDIKEIRKYNKTHKYDDWLNTCTWLDDKYYDDQSLPETDKNYNCKNKMDFIKNLSDGKVGAATISNKLQIN